MQTNALMLSAVQFFSRPFSREDVTDPHARLVAKDGVSLNGRLTIRFGTPLLELPPTWTPGPGGTNKARPVYAPPWQFRSQSSGSTEHFLDPYAELRWPAYALATFELFNPEMVIPALDVAVQCDLLQAMRALVSSDICETSEVKAMADQLVAGDSYRFSYWTPLLDPVGNPVAVEAGNYVNAERGEPLGPGNATIRGSGFTPGGAEYCSLALVWSQAFSFPNRTSAQVDEPQVEKRTKDLKLQFGAKEDLKRADESLQKQDMKGCISSAQIAIEDALRFYCAQWGVRTPSLPGIEFHQRIERILKRANRPSYQAADSAGLTDLLHLYRASLKVHGSDCYYHDDQLKKDVRCELRHAQQFLDAAIRFTFWLDSQA
jgi:hypothetical protein